MGGSAFDPFYCHMLSTAKTWDAPLERQGEAQLNETSSFSLLLENPPVLAFSMPNRVCSHPSRLTTKETSR